MKLFRPLNPAHARSLPDMDSKQLALRRPIISRRSGSVGGEVALAAAMERSSLATASFRVYYSSLRPGAVPFLWESTPGTPKVAAVVVAASVTLGATPVKSAADTAAAVAPADGMADGFDAAGAGLPTISPPPSYHSSQLKKGGRGRCRARAGRVLRALLAALCISRRSRRPASRSSLAALN